MKNVKMNIFYFSLFNLNYFFEIVIYSNYILQSFLKN